jgi:nanoRNase/pAp phosphatase (c-di-AMP/oligoRNAs hydrolase)
MTDIEQAGQLIGEAKNIYIIPSQNNEPESIASALALFYTLKELNKNVNLIISELPEKFKFLIPSLDFISYPKNLVISIPRKSADVSQIYYEKNDEALKIHLTLNKGNVKKENISFYFSEPKPDIIITLGIQDFRVQLLEGLDSFGFLMDSPILNIDNNLENKKFGKINLVENYSFSEILINMIKLISRGPIKKETAECLLAGLIIYTDNFKNSKTTAEIFETAGLLMKKGINIKEIIDNL